MKKLFFSFLVLFFSAEIYAISLDDLLKEALNNNPNIKAAKSKYEAAKARIPQTSALDDPWVTYDYEKIMDEGQESIMFSQEIPFPTKLALRGKVASHETNNIYEQYKEKEREISTKVKSGYAELYLAYKMIEINNENKALLGQLADSAAARFSIGKTGQQDALRAQVELAKINNNLVIWEQKKERGQAMLNILLNRDPEGELGEPADEEGIPVLPQIEELYSTAKENRPELKAWRYLIDRAKDSLGLAIQEYLPDFMFTYENMLDSDDWKGMIGVSIPVWFWQKQNYMIKEMRAELKMAEAEYKNMENMVLFDIKDAYTKVTAYRKLKELYETSFLPQTEQSLKVSLSGYESDMVDFLSLLDSQRMLLEFKMEYYDVVVNLEIAMAELEKAAGVDF